MPGQSNIAKTGEIEGMFKLGGKSADEVAADKSQQTKEAIPPLDDGSDSLYEEPNFKGSDGNQKISDILDNFDAASGRYPNDDKLPTNKTQEELDEEERKAVEREKELDKEKEDPTDKQEKGKEKTEKGTEGDEGDSSEEQVDDDLPPTALTPDQILSKQKEAATDDTKEDQAESSSSKEEWTDTEKEFFKQMSNPAREFFQARLKELGKKNKEVETYKEQVTELQTKTPEGVPANWYENPHAYRATPEFNEKLQTISVLQNVAGHYNTQLQKIEQGDNWQDVVAGQDGQVFIDPNSKEASVEDKVRVQMKLQQINAEIQKQNNAITQEEAAFTERAKNVKQAFKQLEDTYFPQYKDEKTLIDKNKHYKEITTVLKSKGLQDNLLSGLFSKQYAWSMELYDKIKQNNKQQKKEKVISQLESSAGPTSSDLGGASGTKQKPTIKNVLEKFDQLKKSADDF